VLSLRLKPAIEKRPYRLARENGRTKTFYASKLIEENLGDLEARYLAEAGLEKRTTWIRATPRPTIRARLASRCVISKFGLWRYCLRAHRIICQVRQTQLIVLAVAIGHRSTLCKE
jgi:mRNA-degrading endonuclease RelE of RelBE toxin-antitoxin system